MSTARHRYVGRERRTTCSSLSVASAEACPGSRLGSQVEEDEAGQWQTAMAEADAYQSLSLQTNDIFGATPRARETTRSEPRNPLCPEYDWPSNSQTTVTQVVPRQQGRGHHPAFRPRFFVVQGHHWQQEKAAGRRGGLSSGARRTWSRRVLPERPCAHLTHVQGHKHPARARGSGQPEEKEVVEQRKRLPYDFSKSSRCTNPLAPEYRYNVPKHANFSASQGKDLIMTEEMKQKWTIGKIDNCRSKRFYMGSCALKQASLKFRVPCRPSVKRRKERGTGDLSGRRRRLSARIARKVLLGEQRSCGGADGLAARHSLHAQAVQEHQLRRRHRGNESSSTTSDQEKLKAGCALEEDFALHREIHSAPAPASS
eukprot:753012-Hanusia_phi.AAC.7